MVTKVLGKITTTIIGARLAAETGKAGLAGAMAGMLATRIMTRSPMVALLVSGVYVAHKLRQNKQIDTKGPNAVAVEDVLASHKQGVAPEQKNANRAANAQGIGVRPSTP